MKAGALRFQVLWVLAVAPMTVFGLCYLGWSVREGWWAAPGGAYVPGWVLFIIFCVPVVLLAAIAGALFAVLLLVANNLTAARSLQDRAVVSKHAAFSGRGGARLTLPPGHRLRRVADFIYSPKTMARVFDPILADMQHEWMEAIAKNRFAQAKWIRFRGYWSFVVAGGLYAVVKAVSPIIKLFFSVSA